MAGDVKDVLARLALSVDRTFPFLNSGGCCVFASIVADELIERGIPCEGLVVDAYNDEPDIEAVRNNVQRNVPREWNEHGVDFTHVGLDIPGMGKYDSRGFDNPNSMLKLWPEAKGRLTVQELRELSSVGDGWNRTFDRQQIPTLRRMVKRAFRGIPQCAGH